MMPTTSQVSHIVVGLIPIPLLVALHDRAEEVNLHQVPRQVLVQDVLAILERWNLVQPGSDLVNRCEDAHSTVTT